MVRTVVADVEEGVLPLLAESSSGILGKSALNRFEMTVVSQSANSPADGPCYFKEKKRAQRSIIGSTPRYPSHRVTKPESWTMAPAPRWCG